LHNEAWVYSLVCVDKTRWSLVYWRCGCT